MNPMYTVYALIAVAVIVAFVYYSKAVFAFGKHVQSVAHATGSNVEHSVAQIMAAGVKQLADHVNALHDNMNAGMNHLSGQLVELHEKVDYLGAAPTPRLARSSLPPAGTGNQPVVSDQASTDAKAAS